MISMLIITGDCLYNIKMNLMMIMIFKMNFIIFMNYLKIYMNYY